jgi:hypothetical protein
MNKPSSPQRDTPIRGMKFLEGGIAAFTSSGGLLKNHFGGI